MWFGSVHKNKSGRLSSFHPPTKDSIDHTIWVNSLLSSSPKKQHHTPSQNYEKQHQTRSTSSTLTSKPSEGTIPVKANPTHPPSTHRTTESNLFSQIEITFKKQNDINTTFQQHIGNLEITTQNIDSKVDWLLTMFETTSSWKTPRTTENMSCDKDDFPNQHHSNHLLGTTNQWFLIANYSPNPTWRTKKENNYMLQSDEIQQKRAPEKCSQNIITYPQITTKSQINNRIRNLKDCHTR
jgi:hypothetical protein